MAVRNHGGVSPAWEERALEFLGERRNYSRLLRNFQARVNIDRTSTEVSGVTENISQGGMFFSTQAWDVFKENDQITIHVLLPPEMTGQPAPLILKGQGVVTRIEKEKQGVALEFSRKLRSFEVSN